MVIESTKKNERTERMLYGLFLDLSYSVTGYEELIKDLESNIKDAKKNLKKSKKNLEIVRKRYVEINGHEPKC